MAKKLETGKPPADLDVNSREYHARFGWPKAAKKKTSKKKGS